MWNNKTTLRHRTIWHSMENFKNYKWT